MLLFRSEDHVDGWCRDWNQPRGGVLTMEQGWGLAKAWYSDRLDPERKPKTEAEVQACFAELALTGPFWDPH
jgi:hypothetical protein